MSRDFETPAQCPLCWKKLDASTCLSDDEAKAPKAGDLTLCIGCGNFLAFTARGGLRPLKIDEFDALTDDERSVLVKVREAWRLAVQREKQS
jgi:hypothetical protein